MRSKFIPTVCRYCYALLLLSISACAKEEPPPHEHSHAHEHGAPAQFLPPTTYEDAVIEIETRLHEIREGIKSKRFDQVHSHAEGIRTTSKMIGDLALKTDSGVPRNSMDEVVSASTALMANDIDNTTHSGDAATQKVYEEMVKLVVTLRKSVTPSSYRLAISTIENHLHKIEEELDKNDQAAVTAAEVIQKIASVLAKLAAKDNSGISKAAVGEIEQNAKTLEKQSEDFRSAAVLGDVDKANQIRVEAVKTVSDLKKHVPKVFSCPMKCEGSKTYNTPQKCPKCGMDLKELTEHSDHSSKHGGIFFMAADNFHHVEGTLSEAGELRIYFYDNFTRPIPAEKMSATATVSKEDGSEMIAKHIAMSSEPNKAFLTGRVDPKIKPPLTVYALIDFKDGRGPQVFDFDFKGPSKETDPH